MYGVGMVKLSEKKHVSRDYVCNRYKTKRTILFSVEIEYMSCRTTLEGSSKVEKFQDNF